MANAAPVAKVLALKKESTWGTAAIGAGGKVMRKNASKLALSKDTYESNELRSDLQKADFRHGMRRVTGSIDSDLYPGSFQDIFGSLLRKPATTWSAIADMTALALTITTISAPQFIYKLARGSGSYLTDGVKVGDVVRVTAGTPVGGSGILNKNLLVISVIALEIQVTVINQTAISATSVTGATLSFTGKKTSVPTASHSDESYTIEEWSPDIAQSEYATGCKFQGAEIDLPPTGIATVSFPYVGKDFVQATSQQMTAPTAASTTSAVAAINGAVVVNGVRLLALTALKLSISSPSSGAPVVGSNTLSDLARGSITANGQFTAYFQDAALVTLFKDETEVPLLLVLSNGSSDTADFISFTLPRCKLNSADPEDQETGRMKTFSFQGLLKSGATDADNTTIATQDSLAA